MSKISLTTIFIVIAAVTIGLWYFVSHDSGQPVVQPKQPKSSVVKANTGNNRTTANEGKNDKGAAGKAKQKKLDDTVILQRELDHANNFSNIVSDPANYAALKALNMRLSFIDEQVFFRNQTIPPDVRKKMLGMLADAVMESWETIAIAGGVEDKSWDAANRVQKDEYEQQLNNLLGPDLAERYMHYTKNPQCWKAVDEYVLFTSGQGPPLNDDQRYAIARIMSDSKTTSLIDLREKVMPFLSADQQNVYDAYLDEEKIIINGKKIDKAWKDQLLGRMRQDNMKSGKKGIKR